MALSLDKRPWVNTYSAARHPGAWLPLSATRTARGSQFELTAGGHLVSGPGCLPVCLSVCLSVCPSPPHLSLTAGAAAVRLEGEEGCRSYCQLSRWLNPLPACLLVCPSVHLSVPASTL
jgi:hypothetical protein